MKTWWHRLLLALLLALALPAARAAITCTSITSPGVSINYVNNTTASVQTFFTVSCTRTSAGDPTSVSYDVRANNGNNPVGVNNRASHSSGQLLRYDVYTNASCGTSWKGNTRISDTITWPAGATGTITRQTSFWGCVTNAQTASASGAYQDSVTLEMTYNNNQTLIGIVPVTIYAPALCTITTPPGNITLSYAAFGPQVSNNTTFSVTCTIGMPYTLGTDVPGAVLSGLRYLLTLNAPAANGTGAAQNYTITATIPAGQAGTCATSNCTGARAHTLVISY